MLTQPNTKALDLDYIKSFFPALREDYVFFDNAGGSQILQPVIDRVVEYWKTTNVQLGGDYEVSLQARKNVNRAGEQVAQLLNAKSGREIVMGGSSTLLTRLISISIGRTLKAGDELIISDTDHEANVSPWLDLRRQGVVVKVWRMRVDSQMLHLEDLEPLMSEKTKYVSLCHVSNVLGSINPIREIADFVHERGAKIFVDGVAYAPHRLVDVRALDVDFYVYSFYKVYGPHYAVLYGREELLTELPGLNHNFIAEDDLPYKLQPGGVNYELSYGMLGLVDYLVKVAQHHGAEQGLTQRQYAQYAFDVFAEYESRLSAYLLDYLNKKGNVRIVGKNAADQEQRVSTIAFTVEGKNSTEIGIEVAKSKIGIKTGDFYAKGVIKALGLESIGGVVRVSMVHYNTKEEIDRLIEAFDTIF